ncbi:MAG: NAD-binding protein, partial [Gaiellaceae bacterium]
MIGLGRFGSGLAGTLIGMGHEVLGVDADPKQVQALSGLLTHVVEADSTSEEAMRQLGAGDFATAVVAIGTDIEASILTT